MNTISPLIDCAVCVSKSRGWKTFFRLACGARASTSLFRFASCVCLFLPADKLAREYRDERIDQLLDLQEHEQRAVVVPLLPERFEFIVAHGYQLRFIYVHFSPPCPVVGHSLVRVRGRSKPVELLKSGRELKMLKCPKLREDDERRSAARCW